MRTTRNEAGGVLVATLMAAVFAAGLAFSVISFTTADRAKMAHAVQDLQARALAEAGIEKSMVFVRGVMKLDPADPVASLDRAVFVNGDLSHPQTVTVSAEEPLTRNGRSYGTFTAVVTAVANGEYRDLTITATGYVPNRATARAKSTAQAVVRASMQTAQVFQYDYFVNNWGWFFGNTINAYGNVRSNAQFDAANHQSGVFGTPRYEALDLSDPAHPHLQGYIDDNHDGVTDGSDGGIYSGWNVVNSANVRGMGGAPENQHSFEQQLAMPNLSDLTSYETNAKAANSSISIGGGTDASGNPLPPTQVCNAVLGDEAGEQQNLVLIGTADKPIILNGPVVVRGDVVIKGVVTGQGSIYSGRNVYVADNVTYANAPASWLPDDESQASTEAWLAENQDKDFLGLFARQHVVLGDFTDASWRAYVGWWLADPMNQSAEDAGLDGVPGTRAGRDGILGTEDDDTLEGDGVWTVDHYTQAQADAGLLPPGKNVGDVIPGSGEDLDGNGVQDGTTTLSDFDLSSALDSGDWAGDLPPGTTGYDQISTTVLTNVDACAYTNHACGMLTTAHGQDFNWHGAVVSRNESLIYATKHMNFVYDRRLTGGGAFGNMLPRAVAPLRVLSWSELNNDVDVTPLQ
jgi:hypothetical protein